MFHMGFKCRGKKLVAMWIEGKIRQEGCMANNVSYGFQMKAVNKNKVVAMWIEGKIREERLHEQMFSYGFQMQRYKSSGDVNWREN